MGDLLDRVEKTATLVAIAASVAGFFYQWGREDGRRAATGATDATGSGK